MPGSRDRRCDNRTPLVSQSQRVTTLVDYYSPCAVAGTFSCPTDTLSVGGCAMRDLMAAFSLKNSIELRARLSTCQKTLIAAQEAFNKVLRTICQHLPHARNLVTEATHSPVYRLPVLGHSLLSDINSGSAGTDHSYDVLQDCTRQRDRECSRSL